ncbi:MAG TPA: alpha/beta hydrolase [Chloroflexota bacterium]|nr:alpha/beta hydrolase [Chloroflexota bacterium]
MNVLEYEILGEVVLGGHSYGGMVVTGVADRAGERVAHLVYLKGVLPSLSSQRLYRRRSQAHYRCAPGGVFRTAS